MAPLIELEHIIDALKGFKRPVREGRLAVENLVCVGVRAQTQASVSVEALCVRATKIHDPPVVINVETDKKTEKVEEKIKCLSCTCIAGACKEHSCKHAMAVLIYLNSHEENDLEVLTCTSVEQRWGGLQEETLKKFDAVPLQQFCHIKKPPPPYKRIILPVTREMEEEFRAMFTADQPESEAAIFLSGSRQRILPPAQSVDDLSSVIDNTLSSDDAHFLLKRTAELTQHYLSKCSNEEKEYNENNVAVSYAKAKELCIKTVNQDNDTWDDLRRNRFTGTRVYPTYTYSKNKKADWNTRFEKMFHSIFEGSEDTERGLLYGGDSRDRYTLEKCSGDEKLVQCGFIINPSTPWLGFSPDGLVCRDGKPLRLFETKCPRAGETKKAAEAAKAVSYKKDGKLKKAHTYYGQIQ
ncbi:Aspartate--tRNA(Asp/Asn) ligase [Frankliniella fusca]|uniref:Aspartate--tRNA(Asp/Asn) ligase n=1 Tax=Frankliniella fusca TaxID=407009 RepID=A0AAE1HEP2_9NEOP|nr:Aspartate--tRNA(Asp/Asn) ligase [Frankliniella fusca]